LQQAELSVAVATQPSMIADVAFRLVYLVI